MLRLLLISLLPSLTLAAASALVPGADVTPAPPIGSVTADGWQLVWSDEFDYEGLPDPAKWDYEHGFVRSGEPQYYTRADPANAWVHGGVFTLTARKETVPNEAYSPGSSARQKQRAQADYTSASLLTKGKADWTYGRLEMRAKLPRTPGAWPAFWTLGANWIKPSEGAPDGLTRVRWPQCGEIDILEYFAGRDLDTITASAHYAKNGADEYKQVKLADLPDLDAFHTYSVEWTPERMDFYFDGRKWHSFDLSRADDDGFNPFHHAQFILINLALEKGGGRLDQAVFPMRYVIDYVRVYQRPSAAPRPSLSPSPTTHHP